MKTCETCKYWVKSKNAVDVRFKQCVVDKIQENDCNSNEEITEDMLIYEYYEGGSFFTGKNFGCVHHEDKKNEGVLIKDGEKFIVSGKVIAYFGGDRKVEFENE